MRKKGTIIMVGPQAEEVLTGDGKDTLHHKRGKLAEDAWEHGQRLLDKRPEVKIVISACYTPRPKGWHGQWDDTNTAVSCAEGESIASLKEFLDLLIPALLQTRLRLEDERYVAENFGKKPS